MRRIVRVLGDAFESVAIAFLVVLCLSVFIQIIMRNFFASGSIILEELARFSLVSLVFLMLPVLTVRKQHIIVDFVLNMLAVPVRKGFVLVIQIVIGAGSIFLILAISRIMVMNYNVRTAALRMPNYIFYLPVALGLVFNVIASLDNFITTIRGKGAAK